jgi:YbbR domain-containing protein
MLGMLLHNKGLKLLSLILAFITWHAIQDTISFETVISDVPLTFRADEGWAIMDRSTDTVDIHFTGSQEELRRLSADYVSLEVDVRGVEGTSALSLAPTDVVAPSGVRAVYIRPEVVKVSLDRDAEKLVPVKAELQGSCPEGYGIEKALCVPSAVMVRGPKSRLDAIQSVRTQPVNLDGHVSSFRERVSVAAPSPTWEAEVEPERINVEITIIEQSARRVFEEVDVTALIRAGGSLDVDLSPARVSVTLQGPTEGLDRLELSDIRAYIDCTALEPAARYELPVRIDVPNGIRVVETDPDIVSVNIRGRQ